MTFLKYDIFTRETVKLSPLFITLKKKSTLALVQLFTNVYVQSLH